MDEKDYIVGVEINIGDNPRYVYEISNGETIICSEPTNEWTYVYEDVEQKRIEELLKLSYKQLQKLNKADRTAVMRFRSEQGRNRQ